MSDHHPRVQAALDAATSIKFVPGSHLSYTEQVVLSVVRALDDYDATVQERLNTAEARGRASLDSANDDDDLSWLPRSERKRWREEHPTTSEA